MAAKGKGILSDPPKKGMSKEKRQLRKQNAPYRGLNNAQRGLVQQREAQDYQLGQYAGAMMPQIEQSYAQPFDWSQLPGAPVQGDFNDWRQEQIDSTYNDFSKRMDPQFKQQADDFEQQMAERGIPVGSKLYNDQKAQMMQGQEDARQSARAQAMSMAGQNAEQFYNVGMSARGNALNEAMSARNMPLTEYQAMMAARSPYDVQNLGYAQQRGLQNQKFGQDKWMMQHTPRGGGGGGGGSSPMWAQYGFSGPMEYDAYQDSRKIALSKAMGGGDAPKGPNPYAMMGGQLLGSVAGAAAYGYFGG